MPETIKVVQYGLGPIGLKVVKNLLMRTGIELAGVIDIDPDKAGKDVGEFLETEKPLGVIISDDAEKTLKESDGSVVVLSTVSSVDKLEEQIRQCLRHGMNVVSSCEELAYPWVENREKAHELDQMALEAGVTVLSSGVNPGFAMDALPIFLTSVCENVDSITIERHQDASIRRLPFQRKIGAGLTLEAFREKVDRKIIRHVGFTESVQMIAHALGWELDRVEDVVKPAVAVENISSPDIDVKKGDAAGVLQTARGYMNGKAVITLDLQAYIGHTSPRDAVKIEGTPNVHSVVEGGFNGDIATCAMVANCIPKVCEAAPGLKTMVDIGLTSWFGNRQ